jgi:hypothetical protein
MVRTMTGAVSARGTTLRIAIAGLLLGCLVVAPLSAAPPANAYGAPSWSSCMKKYTKASNALWRWEDASAFAWHAGMNNCSVQQFNYWSDQDNIEMMTTYTRMHRQHYALAGKYAAKVGFILWKRLSRYGVGKGLSRP